MLKSEVAEPRVSDFPARFTEPSVNGAFLVIVVSAINFSTVLLLVVTSSSVKLPSTSNFAFDRLSRFAPVSVVVAFVCNKPVKTRFAFCRARVEFLLFRVPATDPPF